MSEPQGGSGEPLRSQPDEPSSFAVVDTHALAPRQVLDAALDRAMERSLAQSGPSIDVDALKRNLQDELARSFSQSETNQPQQPSIRTTARDRAASPPSAQPANPRLPFLTRPAPPRHAPEPQASAPEDSPEVPRTGTTRVGPPSSVQLPPVTSHQHPGAPSGAPAPTQHHLASGNQSPPAIYPAASRPARPGLQPNQAPPTTAERQQALQRATEMYAAIVARQRLDYAGALTANEAGARASQSRLRRVLGHRAVQMVSHPTEVLAWRRADRQEALSRATADQYRQALSDYIDAQQVDVAEQRRMRLDAIDTFEQQVARQVRVQLQTARDEQGNPVMTRLAERRLRFTESWLRANKVKRVAMVAAIPAVAGVGLGLVAGLVALPPLGVTALGAGATIAGKAIGNRMGRTIGQYRLLDPHEQNEMINLAAQHRDISRADVQQRSPVAPESIDVTEAYRAVTVARQQINLRTKRRAEATGAAAAAVTFGIGELGGMAVRGAIGHALQGSGVPAQNVAPSPTAARKAATATPSPHATSTPTTGSTPTPGTGTTPTVPHGRPPVPNNLPDPAAPNTYPWTMAHAKDPTHTWDFLTNSINKWNVKHPKFRLRLVNNANNSGWTWLEKIVKGGRTVPLDQAQQTAFNQFEAAA